MWRRSVRWLAGVTAADIEAKLRTHALLQPVHKVTVEDVSAGCGSFYKIHVASSAFANKTLMQQHRLVNTVLHDEIKQVHGFTLSTSESNDA